MILNLTISQSNITAECNLLAVHNPIVFLVDAEYSTTIPEYILVDILDSEDTLIDTFRCIPYFDTSGVVRRFAFIADSIFRSLLGSFDDFVSQEKSLEYCEGLTRELSLRFYADEEGGQEVTISLVICHAARQFSQNPLLTDIFTNQDVTYYGGKNKPVYVYFYNDDVNNIISIGDGTVPPETKQYLLDYADMILQDFDGNPLIN